jgi:hypothetical protein
LVIRSSGTRWGKSGHGSIQERVLSGNSKAGIAPQEVDAWDF